MTRVLFCISAVAEFRGPTGEKDDDFPDLTRVPEEVATMRALFTELGLAELFEPPGGEFTHEQLCERLDGWDAEYDPDNPPDGDSVLVVYVTGHATTDEEQRWRLVPPVVGRSLPRRWVEPRDFLQAAVSRPDVTQCLLVLDACFAEDGAREALSRSLEVSPKVDAGKTDLWIIAAATRTQEAGQQVFAEAFAEEFRLLAEKSLDVRHLDPSSVTDRAAAALASRGVPQVPWVAAGYRAGGCRVLPNPRRMPGEAPTWIDPPWNAASRGVRDEDVPGWYFTGRAEHLAAVEEHLHGDGVAPLCLLGEAGSGKTAVLGRVLTTFPDATRAALPPVARVDHRLPDRDLAVVAVDVGDLEVDEVRAALLPLTGAGEPVGLLVDNVDRAVDPRAVVDRVLRPLAENPMVRVMATARPAAAAVFSGFHHLDLPPSDHDVESYLRKRFAYAGLSGVDGSAAAHACAGVFAAAVVLADTVVDQVAAGRPADDALAEGRRRADQRLDTLCRTTMARTCAMPLAQHVHVLVACLSAACSFSPHGRLTTELWAAATGRLVGAPVRPEDVDACGRSALAFLDVRTSPSGDAMWRPRFGYERRGNDPGPGDVVDAVLAEVGDEVPDEVAAVLLGAAAHPDGRFAAVLDDGPLLLAAPVPAVSGTLKAVRDRPGGQSRLAAWAGVPQSGPPRDRAFALGLRASRRGLTALAESVRGLAPEIRWATRGTDGENAGIARLACAGRDAVTARADGTVTWWATSDGSRRHSSTSLAVAAVDLAAADTAHGLVAVAVTGDGQVHCWHGHDPVEIDAPAGVELVAAHRSGSIALVAGRLVRVVDVLSGETAERTLPEHVDAVALTGHPDRPVVWLASRRGRIWRWEPGSNRNPTVARIGGPPLLVAASAAVSTPVVVDVRGGVNGAVVGHVPDLDVRTAALSDRWFAVGGGSRRDAGWVAVGPAGLGVPADRLPLDGPPVGLGLVDDVLVVATRDGLAAVGLDRLRERKEGHP